MKQIINVRKLIANVLLTLMVFGMLSSGLAPFSISKPAEANAASEAEIEVGDHVTMGKADAEGYTGIPYWRVLDKDDDGNYLFMSEYLWTGDGSDPGALIPFDVNNSHNKWQESDTRDWCIAFEAAVLQDADYLTIKATSKDDPEYTATISAYSKYTYAASEGILNKDRVYCLSAEESVKYMPAESDRIAKLSDKKTADLWYLRSPDKDNAKRAGEILKNGKLNRVSSWTKCKMRPVFWGKISDDACISKEANTEFGTNDWTVNALVHDYGDWTELDEKQHQRVCSKDDSHVEKEDHAWDEGKVTKEATETEEGIKTFTCTVCSATKTESIPKLDPKPEPKPEPKPQPKPTSKTVFVAKGIANGKTAATISWNNVSADRYVVYLSRCNHGGKTISLKKVKTVNGKTLKWKKTKLLKNKSYKFKVVAQKKSNGKYKNIATSMVGHIMTGNVNGSLTNPKAITLKKSAYTLKKGKTATIKATVSKVKSGKKLGTKHAKTLRYISNNPAVATVSAGGKITAKNKGTAQIYVQTINGIWKTCKVTVK